MADLTAGLAAAILQTLGSEILDRRPSIPFGEIRNEGEADAVMMEFGRTGDIATLTNATTEVLSTVLHRFSTFITAAREEPDAVIAHLPVGASMKECFAAVMDWLVKRPKVAPGQSPLH